MDYLTDRRKVMTTRPSQHTPHTIHPLKPTAMVFTCRQNNIQTRHYYPVDEISYFVFITVVMSLFLVRSCSLSLAEVPNKLYLASAAHVTPFIIMVVAVCKLSMNYCNLIKIIVMYTENPHNRYHNLLIDTYYHYEALRKTQIETCTKRFSLTKITSDLRKQLYIYNRVKILFMKFCKMLILSLYIMYDNVWKYVTRLPSFAKIASVKKMSVIGHKTFGTSCHSKINTHIVPHSRGVALMWQSTGGNSG